MCVQHVYLYVCMLHARVYIVCTRVYACQSEEDMRNSTLSLLDSLEGGSVTECGAELAVGKCQGSSCPHALPSYWSSGSVQNHSQFLYRVWSFEPRTACCVECALFRHDILWSYIFFFLKKKARSFSP